MPGIQEESRQSATQSEVQQTVLLVDDEDMTREMLAETLVEAGGYRILEAGDGLEAQKILQEETVHVAVTDIQMPGLDGISLMQWAHEHRPGTLWIILSGQGRFHDAIRAVQLGSFDFLTKPLHTLDTLKLSVRNAFRQRDLEIERDRLNEDLRHRNELLSRQVTTLREACSLLSEQACRIDEDIRRAELIQRALLPRAAPDVPGLTLATFYRPCQHVGGDLYDIVRVGEDHIVAYVADAAGHGVSAAMLAVLLKHRLPITRSGSESPTDPADALRHANRSIVKECKGPGLFITAAYCVLNVETGRLLVASAGHPPVLLRRADGEVLEIGHSGPGLGLDARARFTQVDLTLEPDDCLFLYTDGLFSGANGSSLRIGQVSEALTSHVPGDDGFFASLYARVPPGPEGDQEDDITMLLLSRDNRSSSIDNGANDPGSAVPVTPTAQATIRGGRTGDTFTVSVEGRGTWIESPRFHDYCREILSAAYPLVLHLTGCHYLDSTFLGTIQELAEFADQEGASFSLEGVRPGVMALFEELGMDGVIARSSSEDVPVPDGLNRLVVAPVDEEHGGARMLQAHEALAALNVENREEFALVIEQLQNELKKFR